MRSQAMEEAYKTGVLYYVLRLIWSDGSVHWVEGRGKVFYDTDNKPSYMIGTLRDVTDQKDAASRLERQIQERTAELEQKNNDLEKMNAELQSFAFVSSHDLQEPLRKIQTFASRILEKEYGNLSEHGKDYFMRMQDAAKRMQTLIEDLLSYSRTNNTERVFKTVKLRALVEEVTQELKELISDNKVIIEMGAMTEVSVIAFQFRQLLHNLIGNSIKFARPGIPSHIKIESKLVKGKNLRVPTLSESITYCQLSVTDNGIGFDPQYKDRIFEVFQRLHAKTAYKGTGIGLAIVKKIVENHNGVITATGEPNEGSRFDIYIPVN
jgi:light-regulated signal transduction histidine kinase (bacteriophytochrome)